MTKTYHTQHGRRVVHEPIKNEQNVWAALLAGLGMALFIIALILSAIYLYAKCAGVG